LLRSSSLVLRSLNRLHHQVFLVNQAPTFQVLLRRLLRSIPGSAARSKKQDARRGLALATAFLGPRPLRASSQPHSHPNGSPRIPCCTGPTISLMNPSLFRS